MSFIPATTNGATDPIAGIMPMMISLIVIVMVMKMMTKVTEEI